MRPDYDVVVVGARVAGASTAMLLARQGHRVLLVDRATMPSDTVSTHAILRTGVLQLTRWGLLDRVEGAGTPPVSRITLGFGDERIPFRVKDEYGVSHLYAPRRILLDRLLVEAAVEAGVELDDGTTLTDVVTDDDGRVAGAVMGRGERSTRVTASMVVGADGFRSRLARLVDAPLDYHHAPANTVHYAYYTGVPSDGFFFQFTPGVNAGFIQTDDGAVCAFVGRPSTPSERWGGDPDRSFADSMGRAGADLAGLLAEGTRVSPFRGTSGLPGFIRRPWGPGWALVGDAGYTKDPISAHGISDALRDAELCARAVDQALLCPSEERQALADYRRVRDALSWPMFEQARALSRFQWDAAEASARMRIISETVRDECEAILSLPRWPAAPAAMSA